MVAFSVYRTIILLNYQRHKLLLFPYQIEHLAKYVVKNCWLSGEFSWKNCLFLIYKFNESSKVYQCKVYILIIHQT